MKKKVFLWILTLSGFVPVFGQQTPAVERREEVSQAEVYTKNYAPIFDEEPLLKEDTGTTLSADRSLVRLSKITVDTLQLESYKALLKEEIEASMRLEPGVVVLYAVSEKEHPNRITILEIYADRQAYESHIQTPHFQKYKQGTLNMVQELELIDCNPLISGLKMK